MKQIDKLYCVKCGKELEVFDFTAFANLIQHIHQWYCICDNPDCSYFQVLQRGLDDEKAES